MSVKTCHGFLDVRHGNTASGENILFPRSMIPKDIGATGRATRLAKRWSQERLARRLRVNRRTVMRLEQGRHLPTSHLVHALEESLGIDGLVPGCKDPAAAGAPSYGPRARLARLAAGLTIAQAARAASASPATMSRFERELGDTSLIVGPFEGRGSIVNHSYAIALGFLGAEDMDLYCSARDCEPWLRRIRSTRGIARLGSGPP